MAWNDKGTINNGNRFVDGQRGQLTADNLNRIVENIFFLKDVVENEQTVPLQTLTVYKNGVYWAEDGYRGINPVIVKVPTVDQYGLFGALVKNSTNLGLAFGSITSAMGENIIRVELLEQDAIITDMLTNHTDISGYLYGNPFMYFTKADYLILTVGNNVYNVSWVLLSPRDDGMCDILYNAVPQIGGGGGGSMGSALYTIEGSNSGLYYNVDTEYNALRDFLYGGIADGVTLFLSNGQTMQLGYENGVVVRYNGQTAFPSEYSQENYLNLGTSPIDVTDIQVQLSESYLNEADYYGYDIEFTRREVKLTALIRLPKLLSPTPQSNS